MKQPSLPTLSHPCQHYRILANIIASLPTLSQKNEETPLTPLIRGEDETTLLANIIASLPTLSQKNEETPLTPLIRGEDDGNRFDLMCFNNYGLYYKSIKVL